MSIVLQLKAVASKTIQELYGIDIPTNDILVNATKPEFDGDYTIVLFALIKQLKKSPEVLGNEIGDHIIKNNPNLFSSFNIIKGFLNLVIADTYWVDFLQTNASNKCFGTKKNNGKRVMVEYASPNTNKPLHLGHLRNIFLGWSIAEIFKANGFETVKTCIVNDRGIHICKSMIAWQLFGNGATPQSTNTKGDHFVGDYYVKFDKEFKKQYKHIVDTFIILKEKLNALNNQHQFVQDQIGGLIGMLETAAKEERGVNVNSLRTIVNSLERIKIKLPEELTDIANSIISFIKKSLIFSVTEMLQKWEEGDDKVMELWATMNGWVYEGFDATYKTIGADFNKTYYESNTYLLGKKIVQEGLAKNVFVQDADSSVWIDLTNDGLDRKIVQRKDGTSVYITQDIGLAEQKFEEYGCEKSVYVIGDEQNYHMKVLKLICQKMQMPSADGIEHLSYGMVELPNGKMKSREGTVVDADDIVDEMINISKQRTEELGKVKDFTEDELNTLYKTIGLGALKFFLLRVDPKKKMIFNPEESIDFHGFTGPFVQYTYARIKSVLRKFENSELQILIGENHSLFALEKELAITLEQFPTVIEEAANEYDPSKIAIYVFNLAKTFNSFYTEHSIANAESEDKKALRLQLAQLTANTIKKGMGLLGIDVPERM